MASVCVVASRGGDGIVCVRGVGVSEEDSVRGVVSLRHVQDIWSARGCGRTDRTLSVHTKNTYFNE